MIHYLIDECHLKIGTQVENWDLNHYYQEKKGVHKNNWPTNNPNRNIIK